MIFVTVGTYNFDELVSFIDSLALHSQEEFVCQIGNGQYQPKNCDFFRYTDEIDKFIDESSAVICHGGTGSVLNLVKKNKKFIAVANTSLAGNHQEEFLGVLSTISNIFWTSKVLDLEPMIPEVFNKTEYDSEFKIPSMIEGLLEYIESD